MTDTATVTAGTGFGHSHDLSFSEGLTELWGNPHTHDHPGGDQPHNHGWGVLASAQGPVDTAKFPESVVPTDPRDAEIAQLRANVAKLLELAGQAPVATAAPVA